MNCLYNTNTDNDGNHNTRNREKSILNVVKMQNNICDKAPGYIGVKLWNELPVIIKNKPMKGSFNRACKTLYYTYCK